ncbi:energy-converting hydrogenase B subunit J [Methanobrevibacter sp. 87.7]|uniref:energy-converting hydrogenase B subunit J n=1 Tax=Methanobrevibacter sp. 87.7 TaxID=387957 RepID=UPI000B501E84|nr:energy-converting hydrogenase B subunit J [Methanobrevibacter sp. 87.7]OWT33134.1 energy-converting hydrogenase B subunit J [Methanobrevibacter sp. 87.7]
MISWGPIIFGFIFGCIIGSRFRLDDYFNKTSLLVVFILALVVAYLEGAFPFYNDFVFSTGFASAAIALVITNLIFGRKKNSNSRKNTD